MASYPYLILKELILQSLIRSTAPDTLKHGLVLGVVTGYANHLVVVAAVRQQPQPLRMQPTNAGIELFKSNLTLQKPGGEELN